MSKTLEDQLNDALARVTSLEADAKARDILLAEASQKADQYEANLQQRETALQEAQQELAKQRDALGGQLITAQGELEKSSLRNKDLETQLADLRAKEQDLDKRAAVKAAQIAAEMGSPVPAKITPKGNNTAGSPPPSAASVWNRQFAAQA